MGSDGLLEATTTKATHASAHADGVSGFLGSRGNITAIGCSATTAPHEAERLSFTTRQYRAVHLGLCRTHALWANVVSIDSAEFALHGAAIGVCEEALGRLVARGLEAYAESSPLRDL